LAVGDPQRDAQAMARAASAPRVESMRQGKGEVARVKGGGGRVKGCLSAHTAAVDHCEERQHEKHDGSGCDRGLAVICGGKAVADGGRAWSSRGIQGGFGADDEVRCF
jgi:hypothetical protein